MVLEKTLESSLDCKEIKPVSPKGNQPINEYSLVGLMLKLKLQYLNPSPDVKSQLIGKDPDARKDRKQKEKGAAEDEMAREHH